MRLTLVKNTVLLFVFLLMSCGKANNLKTAIINETSINEKQTETIKPIIVGANQTDKYLKLINNKRVAVVANQTSVIFNKLSQKVTLNPDTNTVIATKSSFNNNVHLVDSLLSHSITIKKVFAPEHGFRGNADAGEVVKDGIDLKTGLPIISLYGKNKKPTKEQLKGIDILIFDIQDVGARFYTYISSLHYVMEACAENNIPVIVFDRPNPNAHYIDGPILETKHKSFIGMHPIPVVHGMTIGEYAQMINGEKWLKNDAKCNLTVISMQNYTHNTRYNLPIKPSPNLPNATAINLYPSLCFFEGTTISIGRGTDMQFQIYGSPFLPKTSFNFIPKPNEGAKYPKHENKVCNGYNLSQTKPLNSIDLSYLINAYKLTEDKNTFFLKNGFFTKLAGTKKLQEQIKNGLTETEIKATWKNGLDTFKIVREKYLLYE